MILKEEHYYNIDIFPFQDMEVISDLLYYEGPILTHFKHDHKDYFSLWVDQNEKGYRWLIFRVQEARLVEFLTQKCNLKAVLLDNDFVFLTDITDNSYQNTYFVHVRHLLEDYIPEEGFYFTDKVPKIYESLIEKSKIVAKKTFV